MAISHKRDTNARRKPRVALVAAPIAFVATAAAVTAGVVISDPSTADLVSANTSSNLLAGAVSATEREPVLSRSSSRLDAAEAAEIPAEVAKARGLPTAGPRKPTKEELMLAPDAVAKAIREASTRLWTTTVLNLWTRRGDDARQVGTIDESKRVLVTGRSLGEREEIVLDGNALWVTAGYLSEDKPVAEVGAAAGLSDAPCPDGSVENGLTDNAVLVYRSVCHAFPQITTYGGWDDHGEHSSGRALDIMTSDVELGTAIADFLQAHASELHLYDIIWRQRIWTPERASEGWRYMSDRGSDTANHYDHVHVSTY